MANLKGCYSSKSDEWATPQEVFDSLNDEFCFTLDAAATEDNHKCDRYYTMAQDGLNQDWGGSMYLLIHHTVRFLDGLKKHTEK